MNHTEANMWVGAAKMLFWFGVCVGVAGTFISYAISQSLYLAWKDWRYEKIRDRARSVGGDHI